jgi:hypothetical protein
MTGEMGDGDERRVVEEQQKVEMEGPSMSPATHTSAEMESRRSTDVEVKEEQRTCVGHCLSGRGRQRDACSTNSRSRK